MKKYHFIALFLLVSIFKMFAHGELVHQHMVRQAYELLKYHVGKDVRPMLAHLGYNEEGNGQFNPGNLLVIGAYQEDQTDATNEGYGFGGWLVTNTHFWDPDLGDQSTFNFGGNTYSNAYQKARKYIYGGYELRVPYPQNQISEAYTAPSNLFQFYKDGIIYYLGYYQMGNGEFVARNYWVTVSQEFRDKVVWEIFGRICHLLGDMTVPAHVHNDPHPAPLNPDSYEQWMNYGPIYNQWTYQNAINQGGLIDPSGNSNPIKYLFYPAAQIGNFFNTFDFDGNNGAGNNDAFSLYSGLTEKINELTSFYNGVAPTKNDVVALDYCSNQSFVFGIRAIAGLLYWFAKEIDILPVFVSGTISSNTVWKGYVYVQGNVTVNSGVTLTINPETIVSFQNGSSLTINGTLNAISTNFDKDGSTNWGGIVFNSGSLSGCTIKHAGWGVTCNGVLPSISNCTIENNTIGLYLNNVGTTSTTILNNTIQNNSGQGITCYYSSPKIDGNYIFYNGFAGIFCIGSSPQILNNEIINNINGIYLVSNSSATIGGQNCMIGNDTGIYAESISNAYCSSNDVYPTNYAIRADYSAMVIAENNYWGQYPPNSSYFLATNGATIYYLPGSSTRFTFRLPQLSAKNMVTHTQYSDPASFTLDKKLL